jgi:hypothetical protein
MSELTEALDAATKYIADNIPEEYPREVISYSCLKEIDECPFRWKLKYIDKVKLPQTNAMIVGQAIHFGLENYHLGKHDATESAVAKYMSKVDPTTTIERMSKSLTQMIRVIRAYEIYAADYLYSDKTEMKNSVDLGKGVRIEAITDLLRGDTIVDFKTSSSAHFEPDPLQLVFNAITLHGAGHEVLAAEILQLRKDVTGSRAAFPIVIPHRYDLTVDMIREGVKEIKRRLDEIAARIRTDTWTGPNKPMEEAVKMCAYQCSVPLLMACPQRVTA